MNKSFLNYIPPVCVLILVVWSYYTYVVVYCVYFLTAALKKSLYITVYHLLLLLFLWAFFQTMCQDHDPVPDEYRLSLNEHAKLVDYKEDEMNLILKKLLALRKLELNTRSDNGKIRYCRDCHLIKPDRTHHCTTCKKCVLKMDHHCPWVANCVGYCNYKQFVLTLLYATFWCAFYVGSSAEHVVQFWQDVHLDLGKLQLGIGFLVAACACLLVGILFVYHVGLVLRNETTLESLRDVTFRDNNATFDVGKWNNFVQVFGENCCCWLVPLRTPWGNGYEFPVKNLV